MTFDGRQRTKGKNLAAHVANNVYVTLRGEQLIRSFVSSQRLVTVDSGAAVGQNQSFLLHFALQPRNVTYTSVGSHKFYEKADKEKDMEFSWNNLV